VTEHLKKSDRPPIASSIPPWSSCLGAELWRLESPWFQSRSTGDFGEKHDGEAGELHCP
ncbi:unnamed protein product, partial [Brassica napus]